MERATKEEVRALQEDPAYRWLLETLEAQFPRQWQLSASWEEIALMKGQESVLEKLRNPLLYYEFHHPDADPPEV